MRIPFDNKSHKLARRVAVRAKESLRFAYLQTDTTPRDANATKRTVRRARRNAGVAF